VIPSHLPVLGRGHVDTCVPAGPDAALWGYFQTLGESEVLGFDVSLAGREVPVRSAALGQPSPDIAALSQCRVLPAADRCRFHLNLAVPFESLPEHSVLTVRPRTSSGAALGLRYLHRLTTPRPDEAAIRSVGGGYEAVAQEYLAYMLELAGLSATARVLEVGCGIGRMALGLSAFLGEASSYTGLDVMPDALAVARATLAARATGARFSFQHLDVYNGWYNRSGVLRARDVQLASYAADKVDFILMTSLLTHLFPDDMAHYLAQCRAVLAPDGAMLVTSWIMDERTKAATRAGRAAIAFRELDGYWVESESNPEGALAHEETTLLAAIDAAGLRIVHRIPGFWSGSVGLSFQDLLVLAPST
jgi:SAM-dependent methyltransferase